MPSQAKEIRALVRELEELGCVVKLTRRCHYKVYHKDGHFLTTISGTPRDGNALKQALRQFRSLGLEVKV